MIKISSTVLLVFSLVTLFMSSSVLFDWFGIREMEGHYVLFVVIANWVCGLGYLASAVGLYQGRPWAFLVLCITLSILVITYVALFVYINKGGIYEQQTLKAMAFRIAVNVLFAVIAWKMVKRGQSGADVK